MTKAGGKYIKGTTRPNGLEEGAGARLADKEGDQVSSPPRQKNIREREEPTRCRRGQQIHEQPSPESSNLVAHGLFACLLLVLPELCHATSTVPPGALYLGTLSDLDPFPRLLAMAVSLPYAMPGFSLNVTPYSFGHFPSFWYFLPIGRPNVHPTSRRPADLPGSTPWRPNHGQLRSHLLAGARRLDDELSG